MAHPKKQITAQPFEFDQTIVFLRPLNEPAIAVLNVPANLPYRVEVDPPETPSDQQSGDISDGELASPREPVDTWDQQSGDICREEGVPSGEAEGQLVGESSDVIPQSPLKEAFRESSCDVVHRFALRLGFDSVEPPSQAGFTFGHSPGCTIVLPLSLDKRYFTIRYVLESGALMVKADAMNIMVEDTIIQANRSLLLMESTTLTCANLKFRVEFPEMNHCLQAHKENYQRYSERLGVIDARYMRTSALDRISIREYKFSGFLGQGGFGAVHVAVHIRTGAVVAMKLITNGKPSDRKEIETMRNLHHDNIIQYYGSIPMLDGQFCILMELAMNDLYAHINAKREKCVSLNGIRSIATQALSALEYLHGKNITHRDIKPPNILVTKWDQATDNLTIKLCDFGLASQQSRLHTRCGTDNYMAPEVENAPLEKDGRLTFPYTKAVDIYAMGKVLDSLVRDSLPRSRYAHEKHEKQCALDLIIKMMSSNPNKRPTAAECLQSPWLRQREDRRDRGPQKRKASSDLTNSQAKKPGPRP